MSTKLIWFWTDKEYTETEDVNVIIIKLYFLFAWFTKRDRNYVTPIEARTD